MSAAGAGPWARDLVAGLVKAALPSGWTVYPHPVEQISAPAAVVAPRSPYRERTTHRVESVNLTVALLLNRPSDADAVDTLDVLLDVVRAALESDARIMVPSIAELGPMVNIGGVDHISGRLEATVATDC